MSRRDRRRFERRRRGMLFTRPDGKRIPDSGSERTTAARFRGIADAGRLQSGVNIDATTSRCKWLGERMDYSLVVEAMQFREAAAAAKTSATTTTAVVAPS